MISSVFPLDPSLCPDSCYYVICHFVFLCCLPAIIIVITFDEALANIVIIFAVLFHMALLYFS